MVESIWTIQNQIYFATLCIVTFEKSVVLLVSVMKCFYLKI